MASRGSYQVPLTLQVRTPLPGELLHNLLCIQPATRLPGKAGALKAAKS